MCRALKAGSTLNGAHSQASGPLGLGLVCVSPAPPALGLSVPRLTLHPTSWTTAGIAVLEADRRPDHWYRVHPVTHPPQHHWSSPFKARL